jgi:hypothetical protein
MAANVSLALEAEEKLRRLRRIDEREYVTGRWKE